VEILVLASGSSGNAALITSGETSVLVDAGISATAVRTRLAAFGRAIDEVGAVLVSHEHSDHVRGLEVLQRRHALPVWATAGTWSELSLHSQGGGELISGRELCFGSLRVLPVATSHDAREPVGWVVSDGDHRIGLCTDTGTVTRLLSQRLAGSELLLLEANHDADMLRHGPYPWFLKQRIASRHGHLANHQAEEAMTELGSLYLRGVIGLHLSEENNRADLALSSLGRSCGDGVVVDVVPRSHMARITLGGDTVTVERVPVPPPRRRRSKPSE
jgi:phosphoribosyl 1,2-cyclic phosphodiesterase